MTISGGNQQGPGDMILYLGHKFILWFLTKISMSKIKPKLKYCGHKDIDTVLRDKKILKSIFRSHSDYYRWFQHVWKEYWEKKLHEKGWVSSSVRQLSPWASATTRWHLPSWRRLLFHVWSEEDTHIQHPKSRWECVCVCVMGSVCSWLTCVYLMSNTII